MLEAIAYQTRDVLSAMHADADACKLKMSLLALRVDGGASKNDLLLQLQADILGAPVVRPAYIETTALGAALAAGVTLGLWSGDSLFAPHQARAGATEFVPTCGEHERASRYARWQSAIGRALCWTAEPPPVPSWRDADAVGSHKHLHADWPGFASGVAVGSVLAALLVMRWRSSSS